MCSGDQSNCNKEEGIKTRTEDGFKEEGIKYFNSIVLFILEEEDHQELERIRGELERMKQEGRIMIFYSIHRRNKETKTIRKNEVEFHYGLFISFLLLFL